MASADFPGSCPVQPDQRQGKEMTSLFTRKLLFFPIIFHLFEIALKMNGFESCIVT